MGGEEGEGGGEGRDGRREERGGRGEERGGERAGTGEGGGSGEGGQRGGERIRVRGFPPALRLSPSATSTRPDAWVLDWSSGMHHESWFE